jgi:hypothetical protein
MPVRMYLFGEPAPHKNPRTLKIHRLGQSTRPWVRLSLGRRAADVGSSPEGTRLDWRVGNMQGQTPPCCTNQNPLVVVAAVGLCMAILIDRNSGACLVRNIFRAAGKAYVIKYACNSLCSHAVLGRRNVSNLLQPTRLRPIKSRIYLSRLRRFAEYHTLSL